LKAPTIKELSDFTLKNYTNLLRYLSQIYKIVPFCEIPQNNFPYLILRHDVDVSLSAALKMAQMEQELGIRATYFIMFSTRFYNVLEGNNVSILKQISKFGHEIGLHYDPSQYRSYGQNLNETLRIQIYLLQHLIGRKVYSIVRHGPGAMDPFAAINGYINANHPRFRSDLFVHDSCRAWTPLEDLFKLLNRPPRKAQLLTHPENWQDDKISRETLLERFIKNFEEETFTLKKKMKRVWLTDPLVFRYDNLIKMENPTYLFDSTRARADPLFRSENYYRRLLNWYFVNTRIGWRFHKALVKIRSALRL